MKKLCIVLIFVIGLSSALFTQEKAANARGNWISLGLGMFQGIGQYERMLNARMSLGAFYSGGIYGTFYDAYFRVYPWGKTFFVGVGVGYHSDWISSFDTVNALGIMPEFGWKVDAGEVGKIFIQPGVKMPITFGSAERWVTDSTTQERKYENDPGPFFTLIPYLSIGFAF